MKILLGTCGSWHLPKTAMAFARRGLLAGLWISDKNPGISWELFLRCWPFHLALKPFYHLAPQILLEKNFYSFLPLWFHWVKRRTLPKCNIVQTILGFGTEFFQKCGKDVLKVVDCPNSHPLTYYGFWQRECDLWCPGEKVPIPQWMFARMHREIEMADLIVVQSSFCKETMIWNGVSEEKVFINPMGVDTAVFKPRGTPPQRPRFISVGTICLRKGHQYLFRAFEIVKKRLPHAELICVGQYKADFQKERPKWFGTFHHIPHLPQEELAPLLQTCTAFVFPSQEEGIARAQVEALASGLPVIGTHEGGATTLVEDGIQGFIVRGRNPESIAHAMVRTFLDSKLNDQMGQAAFRKGALHNTWQDYGDRLITKYSDFLQR